MVMDDYMCASEDGSPVLLWADDNSTGTCGGKNQKWLRNATTGQFVNSVRCRRRRRRRRRSKDGLSWLAFVGVVFVDLCVSLSSSSSSSSSQQASVFHGWRLFAVVGVVCRLLCVLLSSSSSSSLSQ